MFDFWPVYSGERFRASGPSCLNKGSSFVPVCSLSQARHHIPWHSCVVHFSAPDKKAVTDNLGIIFGISL